MRIHESHPIDRFPRSRPRRRRAVESYGPGWGESTARGGRSGRPGVVARRSHGHPRGARSTRGRSHAIQGRGERRADSPELPLAPRPGHPTVRGVTGHRGGGFVSRRGIHRERGASTPRNTLSATTDHVAHSCRWSSHHRTRWARPRPGASPAGGPLRRGSGFRRRVRGLAGGRTPRHVTPANTASPASPARNADDHRLPPDDAGAPDLPERTHITIVTNARTDMIMTNILIFPDM